MWGWTLSLDVTNADRSGEEVDWTAAVAVVESSRTNVTVRVTRRAQSDVLRPLGTRPKPPLVIRHLIDSDELVAVDGLEPLRTGSAALEAENVDRFVSNLLLTERRRLPVIAISEAPGTATALVNPERLADDLMGIAHVWLIPGDVSWALSERLSRRLSVYNGAIRIWWPGLTRASDPYDHPLWLRRPGVRGVEDEIRNLVVEVAASRLGESRELRDLEERRRRRDDAKLRADFESLMELATAPPADRGSDGRERLEQEVRDRIAAIESDRNRALDDLLALEADRDRLTKENASLRSEAYSLRARAGYWDDRNVGSEDDETPDARFVSELRSSYEQRFTNSDRSQYPLAVIRLGEHFLATLEQIDVPRAKVAEVCAEVACRRAHEFSGRQPHRLRESVGPNAPFRRRGTDGAQAWRCYLENNTPQAARLHWWDAGHVIEFASVGPHDYTDIPE